jgi:transposase
MDVHKKSINVAMQLPGSTEVVEWQLKNETRAVRRMAKKLKRESPGEVRCCYEAGPCGYVLQRQLKKEGVECIVAAPSLIPVKPGERIKTDRRDARKLAELFRAGLLTEVRPPTTDEEAVRDLFRCREDAKTDLQRCRHRLGKMLLRRGLVYRVGRAWTQRHRIWLRSIKLEHPAERAVFDDYLNAVELLEERLKALDGQIETVAEGEIYQERVGWLRCFRGIDTLTAMMILAELHDFRRFPSAEKLMAYLGLVPSEHSSGDSKNRGSITKAGNSHARRVLIEAAWHYRHRPCVSRVLRKRREGQPPWVITIADKAQTRLHRRHWHLAVARGKAKNKVTVAIARELVGFIWAALYAGPQEAALGEIA